MPFGVCMVPPRLLTHRSRRRARWGGRRQTSGCTPRASATGGERSARPYGGALLAARRRRRPAATTAHHTRPPFTATTVSRRRPYRPVRRTSFSFRLCAPVAYRRECVYVLCVCAFYILFFAPTIFNLAAFVNFYRF